MLPAAAGYREGVVVLDFRSLYPSVMRTFCVDPMANARSGSPDDIVAPNGARFARGLVAKVLLDIPVWNFNWQLNYQPVDPVPVTRGDTVRVSCSWDRRLRHDPVLRYIVFAEGTEDEMCFSTVTIRPNG